MVGQMFCQLFSLAVIVCSLSISTCCALPFLHSPRTTATVTTTATATVRQGQQYKSALMMSSVSSAGDDPAISVIRSLADYHEGEWKGRARSFTITPDVAAGVVQRKLSPEYTVAVKLTTPSASIDPSTKTATPPTAGTISLSETVSWGDNFSHRSIPLFTSSGVSSSSASTSASTSASSVVGDLDVDDVDASYSLDLTQPTDFPSVLSGLSGKSGSHTKRLKFVVEHCIAAGENRRCRCFAIYGEDESLLRVVISNETRVKKAGDDDASLDDGKIGGKTNDMLTISDIIEMESDVDRLVDKIAAKMDPASSPENKGDASEDSNGDIDDGSSYSVPTEASRLDMIGKSVAGSKNAETAQDLSPYDISLLEVTNGVWLGDMVIRESPNVAASPTTGGPGKGFGQKSASSSSAPPSSASDESTRSLAEWDAGVQKIAWRWMWNFEEEIRQVVDAGKSLGSSMDDFMKKSLPGNVCVDESFSRRKPKDERMVYIDWGQDSVGFLLGSFFVRLPRYVNFDPSATTSRAVAVLKPFYTEFGIFQNGSPQNGVNSDGVVDVGEKSNAGEIFCSKIGRLYNFEGRLKQGCTSFYTFNRFDVDDDDVEDDDDFDPYD